MLTRNGKRKRIKFELLTELDEVIESGTKKVTENMNAWKQNWKVGLMTKLLQKKMGEWSRKKKWDWDKRIKTWNKRTLAGFWKPVITSNLA